MAAERDIAAQPVPGSTRVRYKGAGAWWRFPRAPLVWGIFALELILLLICELPGVADFQKFGFYDEGAWLHMDALVAWGGAGKVPTVDFGYSYGMLPLISGHAWFAVLGRNPWTFIAFVTLCNLGAAWGMASILEAVSESRGGKGSSIGWAYVGLACLLLPYAIFPNNYSLMHPLEMMLMVLSVAQQAKGRYGAALAFATLAVLTKPTLGYVLGLELLIYAWRLGKGWKIILLPIVAGAAGGLLELCTVGWKPLVNNLLPLAGGKSYVAMHFGFFHAGRDFWWHSAGSIGATLLYYLNTPVLMWFFGTAVTWIAALVVLVRARRRVAMPLDGGTPETDALLVTVAILHAVFVFALYAWSGSWTYYSYLWVIGVLIVLVRLPDFISVFSIPFNRRQAMAAIVVIAAIGLFAKAGESMGRWGYMRREAGAGGLWAFPDFLNDAEKVREMTKGRNALYLVNGNLPAIWPEVQTPAVWFLSPGIQTPPELSALRGQIDAAELVVTFKDYDPLQEAWNWPELAEQRRGFEIAYTGRSFVVWKRRG